MAKSAFLSTSMVPNCVSNPRALAAWMVTPASASTGVMENSTQAMFIFWGDVGLLAMVLFVGLEKDQGHLQPGPEPFVPGVQVHVNFLLY
jgi:hypothetical protein